MDKPLSGPLIQRIDLGQDQIYTNHTGIKQMYNFYYQCAEIKNATVHVDLQHVSWIDGNMCAVFGAILFKLQQENNLSFTIDFKQVSSKCNVLFRNGFINMKGIQPIANNTSTTLPFKAFHPTQKDEFINYLYEELLIHDGMPKFNDETLGKLTDDLSELLSNINLHSETQYPFFVCGQFYPKSHKVVFTVCDLGVGFLPKIKDKTKGTINNAKDAILWAVDGNSTKKDTVGGINLKRMKKYFLESGGAFHIITGDAYWSTENLSTLIYPDGVTNMLKPFVGTTIHLIFNRKSLT